MLVTIGTLRVKINDLALLLKQGANMMHYN